MVEFSIGGVDVTIDLKPNVYAFYPLSATGKTRLFNIINRINRIDRNYVCYTDSGIEEKDYEFIFSVPRKVILFDRYANYVDNYLWSLVNSIKDRTIVLTDAKEFIKNVGMPYKACDIDMSERSLQIFR